MTAHLSQLTWAQGLRSVPVTFVVRQVLLTSPTGRVGPNARPAAKAKGGQRGGKGSSRARPPVRPGPPWGLIGIGIALVAFAAVVIGYAVYQINQAKKPAATASGIVNYRKTEKLARNHVPGRVKYLQSPPVGGNHSTEWQNCMGDVYTSAIADERAVHSMEHGAVWLTYNPSLPKSQVAALVAQVRGKQYLLLSPYPGQKSPISVQAWGYQLTTRSASDKRIASFISAYSRTASVEPGATCSGGSTATGR